MTPYPKRLIEVDLPIKRISAHARREKSIRHGHISTLHIWWARRPLAACRAVICAALWPDPADENCPQAFRDRAAEILNRFGQQTNLGKVPVDLLGDDTAKWCMLEKNPLNPKKSDHHRAMRGLLLDFIAAFANWDASTVEAFLETSRALTQSAHEALGGEPGTRPLVVDPFAGGGSIPLEALRVGADAFASDLNPVAVLLNKVVLEYIPKYGNAEINMKNAKGKEVTFHGLADAVRYWGNWIKEEAENELAEFYPKDPDGATPIAHLWARTILSEAPGEELPVEVPLIRSFWLSKKANRKTALRWARDEFDCVRTENLVMQFADGVSRRVRRPILEVFHPQKESDVEKGAVSGGSATCPITGYTTPVKNVRAQLKPRRGGVNDARLFCVVTTRQNDVGRFYRVPTASDIQTAKNAEAVLSQREIEHSDSLSLVPDEKFTGLEPRRIPLPQYGIEGFRDCFLPRQLLSLTTLCRLASVIEHNHTDITPAIQTCLALAIDRQVDYLTSLTVWASSGEFIAHTFGRQAIPMVWEWAECQLFAVGSGNWQGCYGWIARVIAEVASGITHAGQIEQASATSQHMPDDAADAVVTDPPYYYSIPYADLSDFFYVWLRRNLRHVHPQLFESDLTVKEDEIIQNLPHSEVAHRQKGRVFYERRMQDALADSRRVAKPGAVSVVVFAHTETDAWESLLAALVGAGWMVTGSWPIDTERASRVLASRQSALASSVHLVIRSRESSTGKILEEIGDWRDVLSELPKRIHEWMPRLAEEGVVGADAIFACLGPALEIFSRYSRVEKASGEEVTLKEYLEHVWAAVSKEALNMIFEDADATGFEEDARLTAMWFWTLKTGANGKSSKEGDEEEVKGVGKGGYTLEFDAARKIAQGLGAHLEHLTNLVLVKGDKATLLPVAERAKHLFGKADGKAKTKKSRISARKGDDSQELLFGMMGLGENDETEDGSGVSSPTLGATTLDRVHQSMLLFAAGRGEALKRFLVEDAAGSDARFWSLAQSLSALYPPGSDEKRWVDGLLARKKGLGF